MYSNISLMYMPKRKILISRRRGDPRAYQSGSFTSTLSFVRLIVFSLCRPDLIDALDTFKYQSMYKENREHCLLRRNSYSAVDLILERLFTSLPQTEVELIERVDIVGFVYRLIGLLTYRAGDIFSGDRGANFSASCRTGQISVDCPGDRARRGEATFKTGTGEVEP